jgi:ubiquitin carboxyl-terminal hydrolase L3
MSDATATTTSSKQQQQQQHWFPLESNPQLINAYIQKLGFDTSLYEFIDVFSTEDWALDMIPQPIAAVLMLYPLTEAHQETSNTSTKDDTTKEAPPPQDSSVWFIKQRIGNACGTIALLHALFNIPESLRISNFRPNSYLQTFSDDCSLLLDPIAKAERLENDPFVAQLHDDATSSSVNATDRGHLDDDIVTHFIALVHVGGRLYELDGRKEGPIDHGPTTPQTLLKDSTVVVKKFMAKDPEEMRFTILALAPQTE